MGINYNNDLTYYVNHRVGLPAGLNKFGEYFYKFNGEFHNLNNASYVSPSRFRFCDLYGRGIEINTCKLVI